MSPTLRPYQLDTIDRTRQEILRGRRRICIVMPTGGGKTVVFSEIIRRANEKGSKALVLAHRGELVDQTVATLRTLGVRAGAISASATAEPQPHLPVQVATVQTLLARNIRPPADIIVPDECHHFVAASFKEMVDCYPRAVVIGATATPERGDGKPLGDLFDAIVVGVTTRELVDAGHLVPANLIRPEYKLKQAEIAQRPVDAYREHARGRRAICFSPTIADAATHLKQFLEAGLSGRLVTGTTPWAERRESFAMLGDGALDVLVNVYVATEGFDVPSIDCVILARGIGSAGGYLQMVGRALRPSPSTGKRDAIILDLTGTSHVHGHPEDNRRFSLTGRAITAAGSEEPKPDQAYCQVCGCPIIPGAEICPDCNMRSTRPGLRVVGAKLIPYASKRAEAPDARIATLARWMTQAQAKGYKRGWSTNKYKVVYGEWPPLAIRNAAEALVAGRAVVAA